MFSLRDEAKMLFSKLESDLSLNGEWVSDASKRYRVAWADNIVISLSRTRAATSLFGLSFEYYIMLQAEKRGGSSSTDYWKAQAQTGELRWKGGFLRRGQPHFEKAIPAEVASKKFFLTDDSLRNKINENTQIKTLLHECDPVFCAILVYSDEIPTYPFSVGAAILDYPYEVSWREGKDFFYVVRIEKKEQGFVLKKPEKFFELLRCMTLVLP